VAALHKFLSMGYFDPNSALYLSQLMSMKLIKKFPVMESQVITKKVNIGFYYEPVKPQIH